MSIAVFGRQHHRQRAHGVEIVALGHGHPHRDVETLVAFENIAGLTSAHRGGHRVGDLLDGQPKARDGGAIEPHVQGRGSSRLLDPNPVGARDSFQYRADLGGRGAHLVQIIAIELDGDVAAHAGDQFVEPHLDRLGDLETVAQQRRDLSLDALDDLGLVLHALGPLLLRLEDDKAVRDVGRHGIGGDFGGAGLGEHHLHFRQ